MDTDPAAAGSATADDNTTAVRTAYTAFAAGDIAMVLGLLHPEIDWIEAAGGPYGGAPYRGHDAVVQGVFTPLGTEWSEFRVEPEEFVASGDTVAVLGTYRGTYGATAKSMTCRFVHFWHFREGQATRFEQVADTASMNLALP